MTDPDISSPLLGHLADQIHRHGPLPFSSVVEAALYDADHGFFTAGGGRAGRRGDFITSPEVGPLFGAVIARALDQWWDQLGQPDPFVVVDAGAGVGTLAIAVLAATPRCAPALHYIMVERSPLLRERQGDHLALSPPATSLGVPGAGDGPVVVSLGELPTTTFDGVVIANEMLDNVAFDLLTLTEDGWCEIRIGFARSSETSAGGDEVPDEEHQPPLKGPLVRHIVPASQSISAAAARLAPEATVGAVIPWQRRAAEWVRTALEMIDHGRLVVIDYAVQRTADLADRPMEEWLRTYRGHERAGDPLEAIGRSDITVEVCIDQLLSAATDRVEIRSQSEFLRSHGIDELVEEGRRIWHERAHLGDLTAIKARSRVREAEALLDPGGLGAFRVIEWSS